MAKAKRKVDLTEVRKTAQKNTETSHPAGKVEHVRRPGDRAGAFRGAIEDTKKSSSRTVRGTIEENTRYL